MDGVAADHAAERDHGVIGFPAALGRIQRNRNRRGNFQRAGHGDHFMRHARGLKLRHRALQQRVLDIVIEPRLDDQRARAADIALVLQCCAPRVGHLTLVIAGLDPAIHLT